MKTTAVLYTTLIIGAAVALFSVIPVSNCLCCLWVLLGGLFAVPLYQVFDTEKKQLDPVQGILLGVISGAFAALFVTVLNTILASSFNEISFNLLQGLIKNYPELADAYEQIPWNQLTQPARFNLVSTLLGLMWNLLLFVIFGLLGGLIGASIFKKQ